MTKTDLMENYTMDELAEMVIKNTQKLEESQNEIKYREKRMAKLASESETLHKQLMETEKQLKTPKDTSIEKENFILGRQVVELKGQLKWLRHQIDLGNKSEDESIDRCNELINQNTKLNATVDILLEKLKGKSE